MPALFTQARVFYGLSVENKSHGVNNISLAKALAREEEGRGGRKDWWIIVPSLHASHSPSPARCAQRQEKSKCTNVHFGNEDWSIFFPLCLVIKRTNHLVYAAALFTIEFKTESTWRNYWKLKVERICYYTWQFVLQTFHISCCSQISCICSIKS